MPLFVSDFLDICDPVLTFDRFMEEINLKCHLGRFYLTLTPQNRK